MEFFISRWSVESHTFIVAWGSFGLKLEDVVALTCLPLLGEVNTIKLPEDQEETALDEADKKKLESLNKVLSDSKFPNKSTYASWARHFIIEMGIGSDVEFETMSA